MEQTPNARRLSDVDRNFAAQTLRTPLRWMNITAASPLLRGLISDGGTPFCRLPRAVAEAVNPQVAELYANASGGRLHILTDSRTLAVRVTLGRRLICSHMTYLGVAGLDVYRKDGGAWAFAGSLIPQDTAADLFEASVSLPGGMQELLVYLPLYAEVRSLELGFE
ncbi:MAG: SGNH/GDSL hydrolase N-terminal domain-containing protein, partial [Clostridiales bacterium]|nr:SGNH/GDSL hydrolase N-terminal domain-containing protein [Clostridiales bacterium]